jgi:hypothetical protein
MSAQHAAQSSVNPKPVAIAAPACKWAWLAVVPEGEVCDPVRGVT